MCKSLETSRISNYWGNYGSAVGCRFQRLNVVGKRWNIARAKPPWRHRGSNCEVIRLWCTQPVKSAAWTNGNGNYRLFRADHRSFRSWIPNGWGHEMVGYLE